MKNITLTFSLLVFAVAPAACVPLVETPVPTPDVYATVESAVDEALSNITPTPSPDVDATIEAHVAATLTAIPTIPAPTPAPLPLPTLTPGPTAVPIPSPTPQPTVTPNLRPRSQWTEEVPATLEELEVEIESHRGTRFVFASWGGAYQAAQQQAYIDPFMEIFGIEIVQDGPMNFARIPEMVQTGSFHWHVMDVGVRPMWDLIAGDNLERLDMSVVDNRNHVETSKSAFGGGGGTTWSTVLAYNSDVYPEGSIAGWDAFFDRENFPGRRTTRVHYRANWVSAILANNPTRLNDPQWKARLGAPTDEDVQEALHLWESNPPDGFWNAGSECPLSLISGENVMCTAWNPRIYETDVENTPIAICWQCGHLVGTDTFAMARGLKQSDPQTFEIGQLFIAWSGHPEINARMSLYSAYGPINLNAASLVPVATADHVPTSTANLPYAIFEDEKYSARKNSEWDGLWQEYVNSVGN